MILFFFFFIPPMQPSAPKPSGLSVMGGDLWSFTRTWGSLKLPGWEEERERTRLLSPPPGPGWTHLAATIPPLSPHLVPAEKAASPRKKLWVLYTMVLVWGAAGGQPAPCYRDGIQSPLFQGRKPSCAQHFSVCSVKKINIRGFFFFSSRHSSLNQEKSVRSPTSYMMCYTVNNPV